MMTLRTRRRRWIWIIAGLVVGIPLLVVLIAAGAMTLGGIHNDQLATPVWLTAAGESEKPALPGGADARPANVAEPASEELRVAVELPSGEQSDQDVNLPEAAPKQAYEDFLDLTGVSPDDPRAIAYREIERQWRDENWRKEAMKLFSGDNRWRVGDPLTPGQLAWLDANRPFIDSILALAAAGGLPPVPSQRLLDLINRAGLNSMPDPDFQMIQTMSKMLAIEAQRRLETGNSIGAVEALLAINPLARSIREPFLIGHLVGVAMQSQMAFLAEKWIAGGQLDLFAAQHLASSLQGQSATLPDTRLIMQMEYRAARQGGIDLLRGPFMDLIKYNMGHSEIGRYGANDLDGSGWLDMVMSHPRTVFGSTAEAVASSVYMRATAASSLEQSDAFWRALFSVYDRGGTGTELRHVGEHADIEGLFRGIVPNIAEIATRTDQTRARVELTRAALERQAGLITPLPEDPFNHEPARTADTENETLIYSVGPDLIDQHGAIAYDPTNGTISAGDIIVRIPRGG